MTLKVGDKVKTNHGDVGEVVAVRDPSDYFDVKVPGVYGPSSVTPGAGTYHLNSLEKIEEPTPKFKVGDRVRFIEDYNVSSATRRVNKGEVGTVAMAYDFNDDLLAIDLDSRRVGITVRDTRVEKVESVPFKLERGDKVVNRKTGREGFVRHGNVWDAHNFGALPVPAKALEEYEEHHPGTYDLIKKDAPW